MVVSTYDPVAALAAARAAVAAGPSFVAPCRRAVSNSATKIADENQLLNGVCRNVANVAEVRAVSQSRSVAFKHKIQKTLSLQRDSDKPREAARTSATFATLRQSHLSHCDIIENFVADAEKGLRHGATKPEMASEHPFLALSAAVPPCHGWRGEWVQSNCAK